MKLRNKKTGEIRTAYVQVVLENNHPENPEKPLEFHTQLSLAELNAEWEDYEEQKKYYFITSCGEITHRGYRLWENESVYDKKRKEIGNYFETEEEAEKAVEKLKAWKRLKEKGLKFERPYTIHDHIKYDVDNITGELKVDRVLGEDREIRADLDLLFGGEE